MNRMLMSVIATMFVLGLLLAAGCYAQKGYSPEMVSSSGFLSQKEVAQMRDGDPEKLEPARLYRDDAAMRAGKYDKVILDPIVTFANPYKTEDDISAEDAQTVVNYFHEKLIEKFNEAPHMSQSTKPGPNTLRMSIAITDMESEELVMGTVSTYIPQARTLATIGTMAREKPAFVGELGIEGRVVDSQSHKLLAAFIDRRFGGKNWGKDLDEWGDVKTIIDFYVDVLSWRMCKFQARPGVDCEQYKPGGESDDEA